jgi:hypothetical protein
MTRAELVDLPAAAWHGVDPKEPLAQWQMMKAARVADALAAALGLAVRPDDSENLQKQFDSANRALVDLEQTVSARHFRRGPFMDTDGRMIERTERDVLEQETQRDNEIGKQRAVVNTLDRRLLAERSRHQSDVDTARARATLAVERALDAHRPGSFAHFWLRQLVLDLRGIPLDPTSTCIEAARDPRPVWQREKPRPGDTVIPATVAIVTTLGLLPTEIPELPAPERAQEKDARRPGFVERGARAVERAARTIRTAIGGAS